MLVNRRLSGVIWRAAGQAVDRKSLQEFFQKRQKEALQERDAAFYRANRMWNDGSHRLPKEGTFSNGIGTPMLSRGETLRAEAVIQSVTGFSDIELQYFKECVQKEIKSRLELFKDENTKKRMQIIKGEVKRDV